MNGVTFGTLHSYEDLDLILTSKKIEAPQAKVATIDIPGADGELDYTEYFGDIKYYNRKLSFEFSTIVNPSEFLSLFSRLQNLFNGQKMRITLDDDSDFYYVGRVSVNEWASNGRIGRVVIDVNANPYKLKQMKTVISRSINEETVINCPNSRMQVIPTITTDTAINVKFGDYSITVNGAETDENIIFKKRQNLLTITPVSGMAQVTIEYWEGEL